MEVAGVSLPSVAGRKPLVLIAGGGVAALEVLLALTELAGDRITVELLAPGREFSYRPLAVGEPFGLGEARRYDLEAICSDRGAAFVQGAVEAVEPEHHRVLIEEGTRMPYDALVVAVGATTSPWLADAVTIYGPGYTGRFSAILEDLEAGRARTVAFLVPLGGSWGLPVYELALLTSRWAAERGLTDVELRLITHEDRPLELFGAAASEAVERLLEERGIALDTSSAVVSAESGALRLAPGQDRNVQVDRVVTLPRLSGPAIAGLPVDGEGFVHVDSHGRVPGENDVFAAGDATTVAIKQGGIAAQQADAVAEAIASRAGAPVKPEPFRPVLRGMLLTGATPRYLRAEGAGGRGEDWAVSEHALWWPPSKIAGRYLSPYLAEHHGTFDKRIEGAGALAVEVDLEGWPGKGVHRRAVIAPATEEGPVVLPIDEP